MSPDHNDCYKERKTQEYAPSRISLPFPFQSMPFRTHEHSGTSTSREYLPRMPHPLLEKGSRWESILKTFKDMCFCYFVAAPENTNIEAKIGNKDPGGDYRRVTEDWDQAVQRQGALEELTNWPTPPKALPQNGATVSVCFHTVTAPPPLHPARQAPAARLPLLTRGRPVGSRRCYVL